LLPGSFRDARKFTAVRHLSETDAADSKFAIDRMWATTALAACVTAHLELRLAARLNL
jgi:hypothetical protein